MSKLVRGTELSDRAVCQPLVLLLPVCLRANLHNGQEPILCQLPLVLVFCRWLGVFQAKELRIHGTFQMLVSCWGSGHAATSYISVAVPLSSQTSSSNANLPIVTLALSMTSARLGWAHCFIGGCCLQTGAGLSFLGPPHSSGPPCLWMVWVGGKDQCCPEGVHPSSTVGSPSRSHLSFRSIDLLLAEACGIRPPPPPSCSPYPTMLLPPCMSSLAHIFIDELSPPINNSMFSWKFRWLDQPWTSNRDLHYPTFNSLSPSC